MQNKTLYEMIEEEPLTIKRMAEKLKINESSARAKAERLRKYFPEIKRKLLKIKNPANRNKRTCMIYLIESSNTKNLSV